MRLWSGVGVIATLVACSGSGGALEGVAPPDDGIRSVGLTVEEAAQMLGRRSPDLSRCYAYERINASLPAGADYVAQVFVPNDGTEPVVEMVAAAVPNLTTLEDCLLRTLRTTRFPAHAGAPLTINVPIKAPR